MCVCVCVCENQPKRGGYVCGVYTWQPIDHALTTPAACPAGSCAHQDKANHILVHAANVGGISLAYSNFVMFGEAHCKRDTSVQQVNRFRGAV